MKSACTCFRAVLLLLLLFVLHVLPAAVPALQAQAPAASPPPFSMPEQFSVDATFLASGKTIKVKMYVAKGKFRSDAETPIGNQTRILRQDIKKQYDIFYKEKRKTEAPYDKDLSVLIFGLPSRGNWEKIGQETINGRNTDKYLFTNGINESEKFYYWIDPETQCPLKIEAQIQNSGAPTQSITLEFSNYKVEAQPDSVFELPAESKAT